jgi:hypothetical protein
VGSTAEDFKFPSQGWQESGSDSYGTDQLFRSTPHVLVRVFTASEERLASATHVFLQDLDVDTATIDRVEHADGTIHFYVWGEREQMLAKTGCLCPGLVVEGRMGGR